MKLEPHRGHINSSHWKLNTVRIFTIRPWKSGASHNSVYIWSIIRVYIQRRKQANVSVRMAWISFGALPCRRKKTWWQLASRCCWNRARPWHASELVSFLVGLRTYQHTGNWLAAAWQPRQLCYRPAILFPHLLLTALSFPQRKKNVSTRFKKFYFHF